MRPWILRIFEGLKDKDKSRLNPIHPIIIQSIKKILTKDFPISEVN
jgi:hypothetical protein